MSSSANLFTEVQNTVVASNTGSSPYRPWIYISVLILLFVIIVAVYKWWTLSSSPWWSDRARAFQTSWSSFFTSTDKESHIDSAKLVDIQPISAPPTVPIQQAVERKQEKESWCFVGEDVQGRWCVRVPSASSCTPDRTFESEDACTLVKASSMPLGVVRDGGALMQPLGPIPALSNTF